VRGQAVSNVLTRTASGVPAIPAASTPGRHCAVLGAAAEWLGETGLEACVTEPAVLQRKHSLLSLACTTAAGTLGEAGRFNAAAVGQPGAIHDSVCWGDVVRPAFLDSGAHRAHTPCGSGCTPRSWRGCGRASDTSAHPRAASKLQVASIVGCVVIFPAVAGEIVHHFTGRRGDELARRRLQEP
jgi:hypothetical protein